MKWALIIAVMLLVGCNKKSTEPTYQGKLLSEWITLTSDADHDTKQKAWNAVLAIHSQSNDRMARDFILKTLDSTSDSDFMMVASEGLVLKRQATLSRLSKLITPSADGYYGFRWAAAVAEVIQREPNAVQTPFVQQMATVGKAATKNYERDEWIRGLKLLGKPGENATLEILIGMLSSKNSSDRLHAVTELKDLGPAATPAIPALEKLADGDSATSTSARYALTKIDGRSMQFSRPQTSEDIWRGTSRPSAHEKTRR